MAVFWVQYWGHLPPVVEEPMTDGSVAQLSAGSQREPPSPLTETNRPEQHPPSTFVPLHSVAPSTSLPASFHDLPLTASPGAPQPGTTPYLQRPLAPAITQAPLPGQVLSQNPSGNAMQSSAVYPPTQLQIRDGANPYNMATLGSSLSDMHVSQSLSSLPHQRPPSNYSQSSTMYQIQHFPQFAGQTAPTYQSNPNWMTIPFAQQYSLPYAQTPQSAAVTPGSHSYPQPAHGQSSYFHGMSSSAPYQYSGAAWNLQQNQQSMFQPFYAPGGYFPGLPARPRLRYTSSSRRPSLPQADSFPRVQEMESRKGSEDHALGGAGRQYHSDSEVGGSGLASRLGSGAPASLPNAPPLAPRGPPRKPKQSGHALWVGNLPPATTVIELKDYFAREATKDIESVFLISKSNCAFVNYKSELACSSAMARFHDSRFKGVRLVCRLRRVSSIPAPGVPTGPASTTLSAPAMQLPNQGTSQAADATEPSDNLKNDEDHQHRGEPAGEKKDKFFVVKSLTVEDLESSVRNGIWATQAHNEVVLNQAFASANNVYLIFSANKSGEYFGYARMTSAIDEDSASSIVWAPKVQSADITHHPRAIPTPATETAPKGRVIDDSARGTIFWEADTDDGEGSTGKSDQPKEEDPSHEEALEDASYSRASGRPFKVEWICTTRLPFFRTRGLRNPWNANREVKIARDGTELETSVGARLLQMFHRVPPAPVQILPQPGVLQALPFYAQLPMR